MQQLEPQQFATWAEPIEMLYACHSKVKRFCRQLQILPDYLAKNGMTQGAKNDVQQILNYFNLSAPLHHDDEEKDFFPALIARQPQMKRVAQQNLCASRFHFLWRHSFNRAVSSHWHKSWGFYGKFAFRAAQMG